MDYNNIPTNEIIEKIGSLSNPSKMPEKAWGISAKECIVGSSLRNVENSVCNKCYAFKGHYTQSSTRRAHAKRMSGFNEQEDWPHMMAALIKRSVSKYFRWFDSGDLQSVYMLACIVEVAKLCPHIKFWLPTREYSIVNSYISGGNEIPKNLRIRLSAHMIDGKLPNKLAKQLNVSVSGVTSDHNKATCPSFKQHGVCGSCRFCWDRKGPVIYLKH